MAVNLTVNGQIFAYPNSGDEAWGASATGWATQASAALAHIIASASADLAQSGVIRLANLDAIKWRNAANSADLDLFVDASDRLIYNGIDLSSAAAGNVTGPAGATDNAISRYNGATGQLVQDSGVIIDDSSNITTLAAINAAAMVATVDITAPEIKAALESTSGPVLINQGNEQFTNVGDGTHNSDLNLCILNDTGSSSLHLVVNQATTPEAWTFTHDRASNQLRQNFTGFGTVAAANSNGDMSIAAGLSTGGSGDFFRTKRVSAATSSDIGVTVAHGISGTIYSVTAKMTRLGTQHFSASSGNEWDIRADATNIVFNYAGMNIPGDPLVIEFIVTFTM